MNGGGISVPFDRLDKYYDDVIQSFKKGELLYIVEQKTDIFNFFVDIDYIEEVALSLEQVQTICQNIITTVNTVSPVKCRCLISIAKPKAKNDMIKTGVHLNWVGLHVDQFNAISLRTHIIQNLKSMYPAKNWESIIDQSVYGDPEKGSKGSGLRMIWCHKKAKHQQCGGKGCLTCGNTGKVTEGPYLPFFEVDENENFYRTSQEPCKRLLQLSNIRTDLKKSLEIVNGQSKPRRVKREGDFTAEQQKNSVFDLEVVAYLETFIRVHMEGQSNTRVFDIFSGPRGRFMVKTSSKYCENIGREHNSNHIWFSISNVGKIVQKCFCRCDTMKGRKHGFCKDFSGKSHILTTKITEKLFPNNTKNKNATTHGHSYSHSHLTNIFSS
jgi:hypothetical protein